MHNNQRTAPNNAFCHQCQLQVAGWLCKQPQATPKTNIRKATRLFSAAPPFHLHEETLRLAFLPISWSKIVGMRNILTHDYPEADTEIIWKTAKKRLPELKAVIQEMLNEEPR